MIYFVYDYDRDLIKIGVTYNMRKRLYQLNRQYGEGIRVVGVMPGDECEESSLKYAFDNLGCRMNDRWSSEWFYPHNDILRFIEKFTIRWNGDKDLKVATGEPERIILRLSYRPTRRGSGGNKQVEIPYTWNDVFLSLFLECKRGSEIKFKAFW